MSDCRYRTRGRPACGGQCRRTTTPQLHRPRPRPRPTTSSWLMLRQLLRHTLRLRPCAMCLNPLPHPLPSWGASLTQGECPSTLHWSVCCLVQYTNCRTAWERQDLSRTCQAHHELESESITIVVIIIISIIFTFIIIICQTALIHGPLLHFGIQLRNWACHWGQTQLCLYGGHVLPPCVTDRADQSTVPWLKGQCGIVIVEYSEVNAC